MLVRTIFHGVKPAAKPLPADLSCARSRDIFKALPAHSFNIRRANSTTTTNYFRARSSATRPPRTLVLCFDGTGDSFDDDCTNVVRFAEALEKKRPDKQLYYYQPGIGTYLQARSSWGPIRRWIAKKLNQGFAWYLDAHILGGYRFLMENYQPGDKICLFGFSRGAYTARCLAGMLHKVGLLPKSNSEHVRFAYRKYLDDTPKGRKVAQAFKRAFAIPVPIKFVGVWDTVASVGWTFKHLPSTDSSTIIKTFRHALALDERRVQFMPNLWHNFLKDPDAGNHDPESGTEVISTPRDPWIPRTMGGWLALPRQFSSVVSGRGRVSTRVGHDRKKKTIDDDCEYHHGKATNVQEVWFAGCHADVGGGSTPNDADHTLANPSLQWMISEVLVHAPEVVFRPDAFTYDKAFSTFTVTKTDRTPRLARPRIQSACHHVPAADGSSMLNGRHVEEEIVHAVVQTDPKQDANAKMHDQLVDQRVWLILEYTPTFQFYQLENGRWDWRFRWNVRRPREIPENNPNIHESVKLRENYEGKWFTKFIPEKGKQVKIKWVKSATRRPIDLR